MTVGCVVIAKEHRADLVERVVLPSVLTQGFDEVLVVGEYREGVGYRYLHVPAVTNTTTDALIKRDVGAVATASDILVYLCDDHRLDTGFLADVKRLAGENWDLLAPSRYTRRDGQRIPLNMGLDAGYVGGHGLVIRRSALRLLPWMAGGHSRVWDVEHTHQIRSLGARLLYAPDGVAGIEDVEPGARPWE